jgi:hypothetical protein
MLQAWCSSHAVLASVQESSKRTLLVLRIGFLQPYCCPSWCLRGSRRKVKAHKVDGVKHGAFVARISNERRKRKKQGSVLNWTFASGDRKVRIYH